MPESASMLRLLIVDDEENITRIIAWALKKENFRTRVANSGEEALKLVKEEPADIVMTDVRMPGMTGLELMKKLIEINPYTKVIVITGHGDLETAVEAMRLGAVDFLQKPFGVKEARAAINVAAEKWQETKARILGIGVVKGEKRDANLDLEDPTRTRKFFISRKISNYKLVRVIGEGNIGIVYLCERVDDAQVFALKLLKIKADAEVNQEAAFKRFINEANAISQLNHPNIIKFIEFGHSGEGDDSSPYIVMEYYPGSSLKRLIKGGKDIPLEVKVKVIRQVASALAAMHAKNILHRDVKPDNILIDDNYHVKITDFGVCHLPSSDLTMTSDMLGTPCYLSPEYLSSGVTGAFMDIYALGIVAYEFLLGKRPYFADNIHELIRIVTKDYPDEPRKLDPSFPRELQDIMAKMLKKNHRQRYHSANEVVRDLDNFLEQKTETGMLDMIMKSMSYGRNWK